MNYQCVEMNIKARYNEGIKAAVHCGNMFERSDVCLWCYSLLLFYYYVRFSDEEVFSFPPRLGVKVVGEEDVDVTFPSHSFPFEIFFILLEVCPSPPHSPQSPAMVLIVDLFWLCMFMCSSAPSSVDAFPILDDAVPASATSVFLSSPTALRRTEETLPPWPFPLGNGGWLLSLIFCFSVPPGGPPCPRLLPKAIRFPFPHHERSLQPIDAAADASGLCDCRGRNNSKRDETTQKSAKIISSSFDGQAANVPALRSPQCNNQRAD